MKKPRKFPRLLDYVQDPCRTGISISTKAKRFDSGKTQYDLIPPEPLQDIADVFTMGATKYGVRNWERGMAYSRVLNSLLRHVQAFRKGEDKDQESGLPHMAHVAANAIFLLEYAKTHKELDDRRANSPLPHD